MSQLTLQLDAHDDGHPINHVQPSLANSARADMDAARTASKTAGICVGDLTALAGRTTLILGEVQRLLSSDGSTKVLPSFSPWRTREVLGLSESELNRALIATGLTSSSCLKLSVTDLRALAQTSRPGNQRPSGVDGVVITVANCKGGVGKTTTTMSLAQGLSLRGYRVLVIDADPQGSLTKMFGLAPERVGDNVTIAPVLRDEISDVCGLAQRTYWPGLDLVPASPMLFGVEHEVAQLALSFDSDSGLQRLRCAMVRARHEYDLIIFDTPPSLSLLSATAILAADGLLIPAPPTALDFASMAQLWLLLADISDELVARRQPEELFDFIHIVPSRCEQQDRTSRVLMKWLEAAYGDMLCPVAIPKSAATLAAAAEFGTVYDDAGYGASSATRKRATQAYDALVEFVQASVMNAYTKRATARWVEPGSDAAQEGAAVWSQR